MDLTVFENDWIELNATRSHDPDGDDLDYRWISSLDGVISRYMVDIVHLSVGDHLIELQVSDDVFTVSLNVNVTVKEKVEIIDLEPVSIIISPKESVKYFVSDQIEFNASASYDPDGISELFFEWRVDGEIVSREMTFHKDLREGGHKIELSVNSGGLMSNSTLFITVIDREPIMEVSVNGTIWFDGESIEVASDDDITFDGSECKDPDGGALSFFWTINGTMISDSEIFIHSFESGLYLVHLTVVDEGGNVNTFSLHINSKEDVEPVMEEPISSGGGKEGKGFSLIWSLIGSFLIISLIVGISVFLFVIYKKNRDGNVQKDPDMEQDS